MDCLRYKIMPLFNYRNRQSIRLKGFDYSCDGAYFLTICVQNRECLFGEIQKENMILNDYGKIVREIWEDLPTTIVDIDLDEYIIMPNHFHAIIIITLPKFPLSSAHLINRFSR